MSSFLYNAKKLLLVNNSRNGDFLYEHAANDAPSTKDAKRTC